MRAMTSPSAAAIDLDDGPLSVVVRTATLDAHQAAERAPFVQDLLGGRLLVGEYVRLAVQHHAIYAVLEEAVAANADTSIAGLLAPELARLATLEADLAFLAGPDWAEDAEILSSTSAYCAHLREVCFGSSVGLVAHHYVRYLGDLSGGQIIGRVLQRVYQFADERGTEFYRFPAVGSPKAFKDRYRALLDGLGWTGATRSLMIDEVTAAYRLNADMFYELAPLPVLASQPHRG